MWFREYAFNALIQPLHLLIYTILVGSAMELARVSLIYAVIAIYFVIPAEKLLRKFFGFDNAGTLSAAGSFAGGALFSTMINKLNRPKPPEPKDGDKPQNLRKANSSNGVDPDAELFGTGGTSSGSRSPSRGGTDTSYTGGGTSTSGDSSYSYDMSGGGDSFGFDGDGTGSTGDGGTSGVGESSGGNESPSQYGTVPNLRTGALPHGKLGLLLNRGLKENFRGALNAGSLGWNDTKSQIANSVKKLPKSAGRLVRKVGVGAAGAIPLAMLAAGAMATTGDASKAATTVVAAAGIGASFTNYYGDKIAKGVGQATSSARVGFWGKDFKAVEQAKFDKAVINSPKLMNELVKELGSKSKAMDAIKNKDVQALLNNNITDPEKIAKALSLKELIKKRPGFNDDDKALQHAVAMAMYNRDVNPAVFNNYSRENTAFRKNLFKKFEAQGYSQAQANSQVDQILNDLEWFNK